MKIPAAALVAVFALATLNPTVCAAEPTAKAKAQASQKSAPAKQRRARAANDDRLEAFRSHGFVGSYPGEYARQRAAGECVIDLGYGRWESCHVGGGGL